VHRHRRSPGLDLAWQSRSTSGQRHQLLGVQPLAVATECRVGAQLPPACESGADPRWTLVYDS